MKKDRYQILKDNNNPDFVLPIYLTTTVDEMGVMVGFDGDMEQVEQLCNFSYTQSGSIITVYNTVNPDKLRKIVEQVYTVYWGDGNNSQIPVVTGTNLPSTSHTYSSNGEYKITIQLDSPWSKTKLNKNITIPQDISVSNPLGTFNGVTIPSGDSFSLDYLNNLDYTDNTSDGEIYFVGMGGSRISEYKKYGSDDYIDGTVTSGVDGDGLPYLEYTIDNLTYRDYESGYTTINGVTSDFEKEEVFNNMVTRNELLIGIIDNPLIYSDIFVERGKQSVMEFNLRLGEIDNMGELNNYGNGYFNVRKQ